MYHYAVCEKERETLQQCPTRTDTLARPLFSWYLDQPKNKIEDSFQK